MSKKLLKAQKVHPTVTTENGVISPPLRRHNDVVTVVISKKLEGIAEENQSLKEEMRKRDFLFV